MTDTLRVHNWEKWQSYRKDRSAPPWIKIHRCLMREPKWIRLSDVQRGHLLSIWMLAADDNGTVPNDPAFIRKVCCLDTEPDLTTLIELGFLDAKMASKRRQADAYIMSGRRQSDAPESETEAETEERRKEGGAVAPAKYAFEGDVFRITQKHLDEWVSAYPTITRPDQLAELRTADAYYAEHPPKDGKWFFLASQWLKREHDRRVANKRREQDVEDRIYAGAI